MEEKEKTLQRMDDASKKMARGYTRYQEEVSSSRSSSSGGGSSSGSRCY